MFLRYMKDCMKPDYLASYSSLECLADDPDNVEALAQELNRNVSILDVLAKICTSNEEGYQKVLEILAYYKHVNRARYRFSFLRNILKSSNNEAEVLSFINCLLTHTRDINERTRIRDELKGLDIIQSISNKSFETGSQETDKLIDTFNEISSKDEECMSLNDVDLNNPADVFHAILAQVANTGYEIKFLYILRHLLKVDNSSEIAPNLWEALEKLVGRLTLIENREQLENVIRQHERRLRYRENSDFIVSSLKSSSEMHGLVAPPPPPAISNVPPPPPPLSNNEENKAPSTNSANPCPLPTISLPQQSVPQPSLRLRQVAWTKLPASRVVGKQNIWTTAQNHFAVNYSMVDEFFAVNDSNSPNETVRKKPKSNSNGADSHRIFLLDSKRSLKINIFLKHFRCRIEDIINLLISQNSSEFGLENLKSLSKLLPDANEVEAIRSFNGNFSNLGEAEQFLFHLIQVPNLHFLVNYLLLTEDFYTQIEYYDVVLNSFINTTNVIIESEKLRDLLCYICAIGNYLNSGSYCGNAAGFKITSLLKFLEVRTNKPHVTMTDFIIMSLQNNHSNFLNFSEEIKALRDIQGVDIDTLNADMKQLKIKVDDIKSQIGKSEQNGKLPRQTLEFIEKASVVLDQMSEKEKTLELHRNRIAEYFCDDPRTFKVEECVDILIKFLEKLNQCITEQNEKKRTKLDKMKSFQKLPYFHPAINATKQNFTEAQDRTRDNDELSDVLVSWRLPAKVRRTSDSGFDKKVSQYNGKHSFSRERSPAPCPSSTDKDLQQAGIRKIQKTDENCIKAGEESRNDSSKDKPISNNVFRLDSTRKKFSTEDSHLYDISEIKQRLEKTHDQNSVPVTVLNPISMDRNHRNSKLSNLSNFYKKIEENYIPDVDKSKARMLEIKNEDSERGKNASESTNDSRFDTESENSSHFPSTYLNSIESPKETDYTYKRASRFVSRVLPADSSNRDEAAIKNDKTMNILERLKANSTSPSSAKCYMPVNVQPEENVTKNVYSKCNFRNDGFTRNYKTDIRNQNLTFDSIVCDQNRFKADRNLANSKPLETILSMEEINSEGENKPSCVAKPFVIKKVVKHVNYDDEYKPAELDDAMAATVSRMNITEGESNAFTPKRMNKYRTDPDFQSARDLRRFDTVLNQRMPPKRNVDTLRPMNQKSKNVQQIPIINCNSTLNKNQNSSNTEKTPSTSPSEGVKISKLNGLYPVPNNVFPSSRFTRNRIINSQRRREDVSDTDEGFETQSNDSQRCGNQFHYTNWMDSNDSLQTDSHVPHYAVPTTSTLNRQISPSTQRQNRRAQSTESSSSKLSIIRNNARNNVRHNSTTTQQQQRRSRNEDVFERLSRHLTESSQRKLDMSQLSRHKSVDELGIRSTESNSTLTEKATRIKSPSRSLYAKKLVDIPVEIKN